MNSRAAGVIAFPTEYREGVPRVLLEAALAGLPIVSTSMPGCCAVITDGWNGRLVPPRSPKRLAEGLLNLLDDRAPARRMGARTTSMARNDFSLSAIATRHAALYADLVCGSP